MRLSTFPLTRAIPPVLESSTRGIALASFEVQAHLFQLKAFAAADGKMWKRIRTAGSRPFINPVCRNVESGRQLLDAQAPEFAAGVWAHGSPGHGEDFERLAVQRRAKGPVRAEIEFIRDTVALPTSRFCAGVLPRKLCKSGGAKGLHVYVPLNTPVTYDVTSAFSEFVAGTLAWYPWVFSFRLRRMCCNRMIVTVIPIGEMHQADFDRRCRAKTSVAHQISYVGESCGNVSWLHGKHVLTG
jgi:hypothetical protein